MPMSTLIGANDLHNAILAKSYPIALVDASYSLTKGTPTPRDLFLESRIGDAVFFDIDDISDHSSPLPHMAPSAAQFAEQIGRLGISNDHHIIVYDQTGILMGACRAWWMFRLFGHRHVQVLDGGLPAWKKAGLPLTTTPPAPIRPTPFTATLQPDLLATMEDVESAITKQDATLIDARPNARFLGNAPEPRPHLKSGHMPTAHNVPAALLVNPNDGCMLPPEALRVIMSSLPKPDHQRIITTCGSGITACVDALAFHALGYDKVAVYDGSWAEWGQVSLNKPIINHSVQE